MFFQTTTRLFTGALKALFSDFDAFIRICWAWYLLIAVLSVLAILLLGERAPVATIPIALILLASSGSIAVAWHRNLLLRERPGPVHLRFGGRELRYIGKTVLILLMTVIPFSIVGAIIGGVLGASGVGEMQAMLLGLLVLFGIFFVLPSIMRVSLILPATALDEKLGIGEAFRDSGGLGLPMAIAGVLLMLLVGAIDYVLGFAAGALGGGSVVGAVAVAILSIALQIAATALQIGILTGGYYILRERQMPTQPSV
ncbi:MAG: hypothetical protein CMN86_09625 [Stappia sp.]|nr:hypothetical protein [Stappia sp.]|tara:strand:+ start:104 stop:871 length:768 start_codon:yes stop_codon:yes gene_type:complete